MHKNIRRRTFWNLAENGTIPQIMSWHLTTKRLAERKHRHIIDTVRALVISSSCPEPFWGEATLIAVHAINRISSPTIENKSPYEQLHGVIPNYGFARVFGSACFVMLQPYKWSKLEPRTRLCCFVAYGVEHKGYRCWDPISKEHHISRHVVIWEHKMSSSLSAFETSKKWIPLFYLSWC